MKKAIKTFSTRAAMMLLATFLLTMTAQTAWAQEPLPLPTPDVEGNVTLEEGDYIVNSNVTISGNITANNAVRLTITKWYSLDGRKLGGQPTKKGVYIQNGKKVVIK